MKFRIWTILWIFAVLASALATFGGVGLLPGVFVITLWCDKQTGGKYSRLELLVTFCCFAALFVLFALIGGESVFEALQDWRSSYCFVLFTGVSFLPALRKHAETR